MGQSPRKRGDGNPPEMMMRGAEQAANLSSPWRGFDTRQTKTGKLPTQEPQPLTNSRTFCVSIIDAISFRGSTANPTIKYYRVVSAAAARDPQHCTRMIEIQNLTSKQKIHVKKK
jgi:hypothetical protein